MSSDDPLIIWAISDGRRGMENQVLGLAEAIARQTPAQIFTKRVAISAPFDKLPRALWGDPFQRLAPSSDRLDMLPHGTGPDLWIACGRRTVPLTMAVKKMSVAPRPFTIQTQDPKADDEAFDLIIPPLHDILRGPNIIPMVGAPNRLTAQKLEQDAAELERALPPLPPEKVAVLLGGDSKDFRLTDDCLSSMIEKCRLLLKSGKGLLISPSRRTGEKVVATLREQLSHDAIWIWDGHPIGSLENPYFGILGVASRVLVTEESTNMISDAAFTGKPIHLLPLKGGAAKWTRFQDQLTQKGILRPTADIDEVWSYTPLRETDRVAKDILERYFHQLAEL
ncbi:MAG: mitochondrial fission ELM1 family protein [Pseudomonadota bacterium]